MPEQIQCESCRATADVGEPAPDSNPLPDGWSEDLKETNDTSGYRSIYQCPRCAGGDPDE